MHPRAYEFSLWFVGTEHPQLARTEFWPPDRQFPVRCDRICKTTAENKLLTGGARNAPLKLTNGVRALCLFVLQACGHARGQQIGEFRFEGGRGTPAGTLDQALGKDGHSGWMGDMFEAPKNGKHTYLYSLIDRLNPDLKKHALPFSLQPKPNVFEEQKIHIYREGVEVKALEELDRLIQALWNQWKPALPPYVSLFAPRHEGSSAKCDGGPGEAFEADYQKHVAGLSDASRHELKLVAFADVFDCPAPSEAFRMDKLLKPLSSELLYREKLSAGKEVLRFAQSGFAEFVLRASCRESADYAELLFEFTERCPKLTHRVFRQMEVFNDQDGMHLVPDELVWLLKYVPASPDFVPWARRIGGENLSFLPAMLGTELTDLLRPGKDPSSDIQLGAWEQSMLPARQFVTTARVWEQREAKYPVGTRIKGMVFGMNRTSLLITLEEGLQGMVHHADESWTRNQIDRFSGVFKKGDEVEAVVTEVDKTGQRILLGLTRSYRLPV